MTYPAATLLSLYAAFPRRTGRPRALDKLGEALDRISQGEIDGKPRTTEEAVPYLREKIMGFAVEMAGREAKWIPHPATWLHQSRYLRSARVEELPESLDDCIAILAKYPTAPSEHAIRHRLQSFMPVLRVIQKELEDLPSDVNCPVPRNKPKMVVSYLMERTMIYAQCVKSWAPEEVQYVPNPKKWFSERRYEQHQSIWKRRSLAPNF